MPNTITLRYAAQCADCGTVIPAGHQARYYGRGRAYGLDCHEQVSRRRDAAPAGKRQQPARRATIDVNTPVPQEPTARLTLAQALAFGTGAARRRHFNSPPLVKDNATCKAVRLEACKQARFGFALWTNRSLSVTRDDPRRVGRPRHKAAHATPYPYPALRLPAPPEPCAP